jgi:hypothetical protein
MFTFLNISFSFLVVESVKTTLIVTFPYDFAEMLQKQKQMIHFYIVKF